MFEQASIDTRGALRSPWALAISITAQTVAVSACILVSLIHTEVIRAPAFLTTLAAPVGRSAAVERTAVRPSRTCGLGLRKVTHAGVALGPGHTCIQPR